MRKIYSLKLLKKWLFASKTNNYHPHLLRPLGLGILILAIGLLPSIYNLSTPHTNTTKVLSYAVDVSSSSVIASTNDQRVQAGLSPLAANAQLNQAAYAKAQDMFAKDYWAHVSPDGTQPWTFITNTGYSFSAASENLAEGFSTSSGVVSGWMGSYEHRVNILNADYTETGIAAVNGILQGHETTLVVAFYTTPYKAPASVAQAPPASIKGSNVAPSKSTTPPPTPVDNFSPPPTQPEAQPEKKLEKVSVTGKSATQTTAYVPLANISLLSKAGHFFNRLNWGQQVTVFILVLTTLVVILRHTVIWRSQKRGFRHIWFRAHPIGQLGVLTVIIIAVISTGVGVIK